MDVSLTVIVKDDAENLNKCLTSAGSIAGEIIVVDTGSNDNSIKVARSHGAKVFEMPWQNDFSLARNFAISRASKKWILQLDADEELDPAGIDEIRKIVTSSGNVLFPGEDLTSSNDRPLRDDSGPDYVYAFRVVDLASSEIYYLNRLFLRGNYLYSGKIHERLVRIDVNGKGDTSEQSEMQGDKENNGNRISTHYETQQNDHSDIKTNLHSVKTNISIIHKGYLAENVDKFGKIKRNLTMLLEMHKDDPNDQMTNFYLGATHQSAGNNEEAARFYRLVISSEQNLLFPNVYKNLMRVYEASKDLPRAISVAEEGLSLFPGYTALRFHLGIAKYLSGDLSGAAEAFRQCLLELAGKEKGSRVTKNNSNVTEVPGMELLSRVFLGLADFEITKDQGMLKTLDQLMLSLSNDPDALFYLGKTFINAFGAKGAEEQFKKLANLKNPQVSKCFELLFGRDRK